MPPLTRTDTRASIFSWWSDSNPLLKGPTINLHATEKPLMKWMYHRQAMEFIRKNDGQALSTEILEIYWSYLPYVLTFCCVSSLTDGCRWDYVAWETKAAILKRLGFEIRFNTARIVADSPGFPYIGEMLGSPDPGFIMPALAQPGTV
jgi:hypothetical protein